MNSSWDHEITSPGKMSVPQSSSQPTLYNRARPMASSPPADLLSHNSRIPFHAFFYESRSTLSIVVMKEVRCAPDNTSSQVRRFPMH